MLEDPEGSLARPLVKPLEEFGAWDRGAGSEPGLEDDEVSIGGPAAEFQIRWKAWEGRGQGGAGLGRARRLLFDGGVLARSLAVTPAPRGGQS